MDAGTRLTRTASGLMIGSAYQPIAFERRSADAYQAFRPDLTVDGLRLQEALLQPEDRVPLSEWLWSAFGLALLVGLLALIGLVGPQVL